MKRTIFFFALMLLASLSIWKIAHAEADITFQGDGINLSGIMEAKKLVIGQNGPELV